MDSDVKKKRGGGERERETTWDTPLQSIHVSPKMEHNRVWLARKFYILMRLGKKLPKAQNPGFKYGNVFFLFIH